MQLTYKNHLIDEYDTGEIGYFVYNDIPLYIECLSGEGYDADYIAKSLADAKAYIDIVTNNYN